MKTRQALIKQYFNGHWNANNPKVSKRQLLIDAKEYADRMLKGGN